MSIAVMAAVWAEAPVAGSELLMVLAIADNANDEGIAHPSYRYLAKKTRLSERQSVRVVKKLVEAGVIELVTQGGMEGKRKLANVYRVPTSWRGDILSPPDAGDTPTPDTDVTPRVTSMSDQPSCQPSSSTEQQPEPAEPWKRRQAVEEVFAAWVEAAQPPMTKLTAARERDTRRLLTATEDVDYAIRAIRGFISSSKSSDKSIGALLKTGPNTGTLASRIDYFASKAPDVGAQASRIPDGLGDIARHRLRAVLGEIEEAERLGDNDWLKRIADSMPSGFTAEKQDGRWVIVRSTWS